MKLTNNNPNPKTEKKLKIFLLKNRCGVTSKLKYEPDSSANLCKFRRLRKFLRSMTPSAYVADLKGNLGPVRFVVALIFSKLSWGQGLDRVLRPGL